MQDYVFSDSQALSTLDTTGIISTNVFDLELTGSGGATIITDDQIEAYLNVLITGAPASQAGVEGMYIDLRTDDDANLAFGSEPDDGDSSEQILGLIHVKEDDMVAGKKFSIRVLQANLGKYLGVWYRAGSTGLTTGVTVDAWLSDTPVSENEDIQKTSNQY